jgi:hypothetical protein
MAYATLRYQEFRKKNLFLFPVTFFTDYKKMKDETKSHSTLQG